MPGPGFAGRHARGRVASEFSAAAKRYVARKAIYGALRGDLDPRYPGSRKAANVPYTASESVGFFGLANH